MMRNLIIVIFFFFGPALLMFFLRNLVMLLLMRMKRRQQEEKKPEIIDITPVEKRRAPRWFYLLVLLVSLVSAVSVFLALQETAPPAQRVYVPAYVDESGEIVPGHWKQE